MQATGVVRRIDDLGRIVIPRDIRQVLTIQEGDPLEIYIDEEGVYLKKITSSDITNLRKALNDFITSDCKKSKEVKSIAYALQVVLDKEMES